MYTYPHVHMNTCIHVYITSLMLLGLDLPSLAMFRLVCLDTLFHHILHKSTYGETLLVSYCLYLIYKFPGADKGEMSPGFIIRRIALYLRTCSRNLLLLRSPRRFVKSVLRMNGSLSENVCQAGCPYSSLP